MIEQLFRQVIQLPMFAARNLSPNRVFPSMMPIAVQL
jgi:hypothetical protein